ncbi:hypothetical protein [Nocardioides marmotae]|uniref:hypothetical protein n=1 Tax=Nocardioides marmotae TaxID=2663857 RepID=UPI0012B541F2|nr:hypothetical protein [Nocardioides marmotae]MBC9734918.1 hypothetical protein [Nocardioides marmotae]MTB86017.1 hypothetical protein [Nocardioides marmotae]
MNNPAAANLVATTIGTVKWVAVAGFALLGAFGVLGGLLSGEVSGVLVGLMVLVASALCALLMWVLFGWFEQTLRMLADIAVNTGSRTAAPSPPGY